MDNVAAKHERLGMWIFLSSELLLFAGLFTLYAAYRVTHTEAFLRGVDLNNRTLGTLNTAVLLTSSYTVACAVRALQQNARKRCMALLATTLFLGTAFLGIKGIEYLHHIHDGLALGKLATGYGNDGGLRSFFALYYALTGTHAVHVSIGLLLLTAALVRIMCAGSAGGTKHAPWLELLALYWHFVDLVWLLLWPLFYLTGSPP